jgi:hypothetical protein
MRVSVRVGELRVDLSGGEWSVREVRGLVRLLASVHLSLSQEGVFGGADDEGSAGSAPIGFSAVLERASEVSEDYSEFFEEESL